MKEIEERKLIDALKKLIKGEETLVREVKQTISLVDECLHHSPMQKIPPCSESDRDKT